MPPYAPKSNPHPYQRNPSSNFSIFKRLSSSPQESLPTLPNYEDLSPITKRSKQLPTSHRPSPTAKLSKRNIMSTIARVREDAVSTLNKLKLPYITTPTMNKVEDFKTFRDKMLRDLKIFKVDWVLFYHPDDPSTHEDLARFPALHILGAEGLAAFQQNSEALSTLHNLTDHIVLPFIMNHIEPKLLSSFSDATSACDLWQKLHSMFLNWGNSAVNNYRREFRNIKWRPNDTLLSFLGHFDELLGLVALTSEPIFLNDQIETLLDALPDRFEFTVKFIRRNRINDMYVIRTHLQEDEYDFNRKVQSQEPSRTQLFRVDSSHTLPQRNEKPPQSGERPPLFCTYCQRPGHLITS